MYDLETLGWGEFFQQQLDALSLPVRGLVPARVTGERKGFYEVAAAGGRAWAKPSGRIQHQAASRQALPAVGDWVAVQLRQAEQRATIHHLFERRTCLVRHVPGRRTGAQVLGANLDVVLVVTSFGGDFNLPRIERYLSAVRQSGAEPVLLLNKCDLVASPAPFVQQLEQGGVEVTVVVLSALTGVGSDGLDSQLARGRTLGLVGSSGVGKSTLINRLVGEDVQRVAAVQERDGRGRHTTTHRQLIVLDRGLLMDTPGMRELQPWESAGGIQETFADIEALQACCRFADCHHDSEPGCAVQQALEAGEIEAERLDRFVKLTEEAGTQTARRAEAERLAESRHHRQRSATQRPPRKPGGRR